MSLPKGILYFWGNPDVLEYCKLTPEKELTSTENRQAVGVIHTTKGKYYLIPKKDLYPYFFK